MTTITPDLRDVQHSVQEGSSQEERRSSFRRIFEEEEEKTLEESEDQPCLIQLFELPRAHFQIEGEVCERLSEISASRGVQELLSSEIEALFEKMASLMLLHDSALEEETTFFLEGKQFQNSLFYGTQIKITEFSSAPKAFNVSIATTYPALVQLEVHKAALLKAFARGGFSFSVHRLDLEVRDEKPLVHRKEDLSEEEEELSQ
ncbi:MAG: hypothetical protein HYZ48_04940 [Chlamydiales bacterium]|nr:hypothetical protein [Chlamydiales bacterium]